MKKTYGLTLLIILIFPFFIKGQDSHFSQYNETPVSLNPALSCVAYDTRVIANYKDQWTSVNSPYKTYGISIEKTIKHLKLNKNYIGMSLNVFNDKAGDLGLGTLSANVGVNAVIKLDASSKLSGGISAGIASRSINSSKMRWESQYDGYTYNSATASGEVAPKTSFIQADFGGGFNYHYAKSERYISSQDGTKFDVGFSVFHFNSPSYAFTPSGDKQFIKLILHTNFDVGIEKTPFALVPSLLFMRQGPSQEINAGMMFKYIFQDQSTYTTLKKASALSIGAHYRVGDAVIPCILIQYDKFALGFSYDVNISKLTSASKSKGGMEVSLRFNTSPGYGKSLGGNFSKPKRK